MAPGVWICQLVGSEVVAPASAVVVVTQVLAVPTWMVIPTEVSLIGVVVGFVMTNSSEARTGSTPAMLTVSGDGFSCSPYLSCVVAAASLATHELGRDTYIMSYSSVGFREFFSFRRWAA